MKGMKPLSMWPRESHDELLKLTEFIANSQGPRIVAMTAVLLNGMGVKPATIDLNRSADTASFVLSLIVYSLFAQGMQVVPVPAPGTPGGPLAPPVILPPEQAKTETPTG